MFSVTFGNTGNNPNIAKSFSQWESTEAMKSTACVEAETHFKSATFVYIGSIISKP